MDKLSNLTQARMTWKFHWSYLKQSSNLKQSWQLVPEQLQVYPDTISNHYMDYKLTTIEHTNLCKTFKLRELIMSEKSGAVTCYYFVIIHHFQSKLVIWYSSLWLWLKSLPRCKYYGLLQLTKGRNLIIICTKPLQMY